MAPSGPGVMLMTAVGLPLQMLFPQGRVPTSTAVLERARQAAVVFRRDDENAVGGRRRVPESRPGGRRRVRLEILVVEGQVADGSSVKVQPEGASSFAALASMAAVSALAQAADDDLRPCDSW